MGRCVWEATGGEVWALMSLKLTVIYNWTAFGIASIPCTLSKKLDGGIVKSVGCYGYKKFKKNNVGNLPKRSEVTIK